jgi:hypothetical protein
MKRRNVDHFPFDPSIFIKHNPQKQNHPTTREKVGSPVIQEQPVADKVPLNPRISIKLTIMLVSVTCLFYGNPYAYVLPEARISKNYCVTNSGSPEVI